MISQTEFFWMVAVAVVLSAAITAGAIGCIFYFYRAGERHGEMKDRVRKVQESIQRGGRKISGERGGWPPVQAPEPPPPPPDRVVWKP